MKIGDEAPDATLHMGDGTTTSIAAFRGRPLILYFYPKDDTSGCTKEAQAFSALMPDFDALGVAVVGVSRDPVRSHAKFTQKYDLSVPLASDEDGSVCEAYGTWVEKSMYGKSYMGIERATFLIDAEGRLAQVWRKVKVPGHAESVAGAARDLLTRQSGTASTGDRV